jgi:hypothetical protein
VATDEDIVSGLAPGRLAVTRIVGKSTLGRSLTGRDLYPTIPKSSIAAIINDVITGRLMNIPERFKCGFPRFP